MTKYDASLFIHVNIANRMYALIYVDDIIITNSATLDIDVFVKQLHFEFTLKDMGDLH